MLELADLLNVGLGEEREITDDTKECALGVRVNDGPTYCTFRHDKAWKLSLNLWTWQVLGKMTKESFGVRVWARMHCVEG